MIIGSGNIANALKNRDGYRFFASGVSNSSMQGTTEDKENCMREAMMLGIHMARANVMKECFVYFGSISCFLKSTEYTRHKETMEESIRQVCDNYCIIRLGNLDWDTNPNTFLNYLRNKKAKGEHYEIREELKYMISKEQLRFITDNLPLTGKHEISIFGKMKLVKDLI